MKFRLYVPILISLSTLLLAACGAASPQSPTPSAATETPTVMPAQLAHISSAAAGVALFEQDCTPCHGISARGADGPGLRSNTYVLSADLSSLEATIAEGFSGSEMPGWSQANGGPYTIEQIAWVANYLKQIQPSAAEPTPTPESLPSPTIGDAQRGRGLFGQYCASCHGPQGVQGLPNPGSDDGSVPALNPIDPEIVDPHPEVFAENVNRYLAEGSIPDGSGPLMMMPAFGFDHLLDSGQIDDIIAYLLEINGVNPAGLGS
jgi:mono/diheme cytochrome c family protein